VGKCSVRVCLCGQEASDDCLCGGGRGGGTVPAAVNMLPATLCVAHPVG
jgi:hypothetical protein